MRILILGGNGQLGLQLVHSFAGAGHAVTCLARGTHPIPSTAEFIRADRDDAEGLSEAARFRWDAIVDLATQPGRVRRAVSELSADHWIYVSSVSVYQRGDVCGQAEDSATCAPLSADTLSDVEDYGAAKVACEEAIRAEGRSCTIIRAGLIAGEGDDSGRSGYYPWRFAHPTGDDVVVPADPDFPLAMIDVKDVAAWAVRCAEHAVNGTFNATGPVVTLREALDTARRVSGSRLPVRPVEAGLLLEQGVGPWMGPDSLPWWIPDPDFRYTVTADSRRAREQGLNCRPLDETLADALAYEQSRGGPVGAGLTDETERRIRAALPPKR